MSLPSLTLPGALPAFLISQHALAGQELYANVKAAQGHPRKRRLTTSRVVPALVSFELTAAQMATLDDFFENALTGGQRQFSARLSGMGAPLQWWACAAAAPYKCEPKPSALGVMWTVSWPLILLGEPSLSAPPATGLSLSLLLELDGSATVLGSTALSLALGLPLTVSAPLSLALLLSLDASEGGGTFAPGAAAAILAGIAPAMLYGAFVSPGAGSLAIAGNMPSEGSLSAPGSGSLALAGLAPSLGLSIFPSQAALALAGNAPTFSIAALLSISPPAGALSMSGNAPTPGDAYFSDVAALLHGDGTNGSTTFTDSSSHGYSFAKIAGAPVIDTSQSVFGGASMYFPGSNAAIQAVGTSHRFDVTTGDFTLEMWIRPAAIGSGMTVAINNTGTGFCAYEVFVTAAGKVEVLGYDTGSTLVYNITGATTLSAGTWYHVALTRHGSTFTLWVGGSSDGTATSATALRNSSDPLTLGTQGGGGSSYNGWIDDFRLTIGVARYTSGFTPPTAAFPDHG